ncbi:alpha/beta hydrolase [Salinifilum ghardaiensis]
MRDGFLDRRRLLRYAGLLAAGAAAAGCTSEADSTPAPPPEPGGATSQAPQEQESADGVVVRTEEVYSEYRHTNVQLWTAHPSTVDEKDLGELPWVLYLHGRDGINPSPVPGDTLSSLGSLARSGEISPFGLVSAGGGYNAYWCDNSANGRLASMLREELPQWMVHRGLGGRFGEPSAVAGISTGGFGAFNYTIDRSVRGNPVSALAALSPAVPTTWAHMREKHAFVTEQEWRRTEPIGRMHMLGERVPVGIWVGDEDAFFPGARRLRAEHRNTPVFSVLPGGHDGSVFNVVGADMVRFLDAHLPR